jgi:hypothetical protein
MCRAEAWASADVHPSAPKQGGLRSDLVELIGGDAEILMSFAQFAAGALKGSAGLLAELQALPASEAVA